MRGSRSLCRLPLALVAAATLAGCGRTAGPSWSAPPAPTSVQSDQLFFGRDIPGGGTVSDSAWAAFLADVVTPRLPSGFTVFRTDGQWRSADGSIARELGFVLRVDHPAGQPPDSTFDAIAMEYVRRFRQEAVLRVRSPAQQWLYRAVPF